MKCDVCGGIVESPYKFENLLVELVPVIHEDCIDKWLKS